MSLIEVVAVLALLSVGSAQVTITNAPQSTRVFEGNNATFRCTAEDNGSPVTVGWRFTPSGSSSEVSLSTGATLTGIEMVTVSGDQRTLLTFSGVRREADGGTVVCVVAVDRSNPALLTVQWPPVLSSEEMSISLREGESDTFNFTVDVGNPRSNMNITGPAQPGNARVSISSEGVSINGVSRDDAGTHIATWTNIEGVATFTLDLKVTWPPVLSSEGMSVSLREGDNDTFNFTVDVGNPRSTMTITGPSQPGNAHVSISSEGVVSINGVSRDDAGTHIATWTNSEGVATFTLDLKVISLPSVFGIGVIIGIILASIVFLLLVIVVVAVVILVCCICCECCICYIWCNKCRQKRSEDEEEDKGVSLT